MTRWTEERRRKQAEAIKRWKPWEKSTGPKSEKGKENVKLNALKHGSCSVWAKDIAAAAYHSRKFLEHVEGSIAAERALAAKANKLLENRAKSDE